MSGPGIAIWSLGSHARRNLGPAAMDSHWRLIGCYSRNSEVAEAFARENGTTAYPDADAMLADPDVRAVLIAGPNGVHHDQAVRALNAGKAVLIEKSLCETLDQAMQLADLGRTKGLLVAECFSYLFHPQFLRLAALITDRALMGHVASITAEFGFPHRALDDIRYRADLGGGALLDVGAYCLSGLSRMLSGTPRLAWAKMDSQNGHRVDTGGQALLISDDGVVGICNWGFGRAYRNRVQAWGERASVTTDRVFARPPEMETAIVILHQQDNRTETIKVEAANPFVRMLDHMMTALDDSSAQERLRTEFLRQAALVQDVRHAAKF